ncbi:MAG: hypothetical protein ACRDBO_06725 [Lachnospiraceae bacterium]
MEWLSRTSKQLVLELSVGVVLFNAVLAVIASILLPKVSYPLLPVMAGLGLGAIGAVVMLIHMAVMTERVLASQNENYANKTTVLHSMVRKLLFVAALLCCWRFFDIDLLAAVIGTMGMKAGAFFQPTVHKILFRGKDQMDSTTL